MTKMNTKKSKNDMTLWYQQPATSWRDGLPIGNGRIGAMVLGERLAANQVVGGLVIASGLAVIDVRLVGWLTRRRASAA